MPGLHGVGRYVRIYSGDFRSTQVRRLHLTTGEQECGWPARRSSNASSREGNPISPPRFGPLSIETPIPARTFIGPITAANIRICRGALAAFEAGEEFV